VPAPDWRRLAGELYRALRPMPCRCGRSFDKIKGVDRISRQCARCAAVAAFELASAGEANSNA